MRAAVLRCTAGLTGIHLRNFVGPSERPAVGISAHSSSFEAGMSNVLCAWYRNAGISMAADATSRDAADPAVRAGLRRTTRAPRDADGAARWTTR